VLTEGTRAPPGSVHFWPYHCDIADLIGDADIERMTLVKDVRLALGAHSHRVQTCPAPQTAHLRASLRMWRLVVLAIQTPLTRVRPTPHPTAICVIMVSVW
jgi:hypothetical protein